MQWGVGVDPPTSIVPVLSRGDGDLLWVDLRHTSAKRAPRNAASIEHRLEAWVECARSRQIAVVITRITMVHNWTNVAMT